MQMIKKYWWLIAAVLIYFNWDKVKTMLGQTTVTTPPPAPEPVITEPTETITENN